MHGAVREHRRLDEVRAVLAAAVDHLTRSEHVRAAPACAVFRMALQLGDPAAVPRSRVGGVGDRG
jgi:hypothetical protein